jgi:hypothetical protein|tara:strand:+ start:3439 stop:4029 length:591 start_codon:yes stop_codon:yes gene_type:complete
MGLLDSLLEDTNQRAFQGYGFNELINKAKTKYPYLKNVPMSYTKGDGYLEAYQVGEGGSSQYPRPKSLPINKFSIDIRNKDTTPEMIAGDYVSHHMTRNNPFIKDNYNQFINSLTPKQLDRQKNRYNDYTRGYYVNEQGNKVELPIEKRSFDNWKSVSDNDGIYRGLLFNQWNPNRYTPEQHELNKQAQKYLQGLL